MKITFNEKATKKNLVVVVADKIRINKDLFGIGEEVKRAMALDSFKNKFGESVTTLAPKDSSFEKVIIFSAGSENDLNEIKAQNLGGKIASCFQCCKIEEAALLSCLENEKFSTSIAYGAAIKEYNFDKYKSAEKVKDKIYINELEVVSNNPSKNQNYFDEQLKPILDGIKFTRDLISEPGNILYPETLAEQCKTLAKLGVKVEVLDKKKIEKLGMGALLGVAQGSVRDPRVVVMHWNGGKKGDAPVAFVGKGVTFDSGGLSLKPGNAMEGMKYDMGGSAVVTGLIKTLAGRKAKVNAIGVIGCVENMPDGNAQRPDDVVKSMSGQTIEILNTDAEGRLVLADVLWYTQDRFQPKFMIDLATLTGAIVIALGHEYAGLFSNDDKLSEQLAKVGELTNEKVWRLPLHQEYDKDIDSDIADVRNTQKTARAAGSITAAQFLQRFVNKTPWVHLDIAGVNWADRPLDLSPKGASGFGVRLLNQLVADYYEGE